MAEEKKETTKAKEPTKVYEAKYTISELAKAAKSEFDTTSIVVTAALTKAGKEAYTMKEAKQLVERFKHKEVKA